MTKTAYVHPIRHSDAHVDQTTTKHLYNDRGMTLRDHFASMVMSSVAWDSPHADMDHMARRCYQFADAMLRARAEPQVDVDSLIRDIAAKSG